MGARRIAVRGLAAERRTGLLAAGHPGVVHSALDWRERQRDWQWIREGIQDERAGREVLDLDLLSGAQRLGQLVGVGCERTRRCVPSAAGYGRIRRQAGG